MKEFNLKILACERLFFEGKVESLIIPTTDGELGILGSHCNMVSAIVPGTVKYKINDKWNYGSASDGIVKVENGDVLVLVDTIEKPEEIDAEYQKRRIEEINEEIQQKQSISDYYSSKARLARAIARLKTKSYENQQF